MTVEGRYVDLFSDRGLLITQIEVKLTQSSFTQRKRAPINTKPMSYCIFGCVLI